MKAAEPLGGKTCGGWKRSWRMPSGVMARRPQRPRAGIRYSIATMTAPGASGHVQGVEVGVEVGHRRCLDDRLERPGPAEERNDGLRIAAGEAATGDDAPALVQDAEDDSLFVEV